MKEILSTAVSAAWIYLGRIRSIFSDIYSDMNSRYS